MTRYLLTLEYDGTAFCGWQRQVGCVSVQEALEGALAPLCGQPVRVVGAGRTDAGVHALGQRAHFDTAVERPEGVWLRALNATTPESVAVVAIQGVGEGLHARFSACYREYRYRLSDRLVAPPPLERGRVWWQRGELDVGAMGAAGRCLVGEHDFSAFRAAACQARSPVRRLVRLEVVRRGEEVWVEVGANAFLHHMVRNLVGSLVRVGRGEWRVERVGEVLAGRDRRLAAPTAPPQGLYLTRVLYPPEQLAGEAPPPGGWEGVLRAGGEPEEWDPGEMDLGLWDPERE